MSSQEFKSSNPYGLSDQEKWHLDEIIMKYWEAENDKDRKHIELECYKHFKWMGFKPFYINYLKDNNCPGLAEEMKHCVSVYKKVDHAHEKQSAA